MKCPLVAIADIVWLLAGLGTIAANQRPWLNRFLDERFEHGCEPAAGRHGGHSITRSARTSSVCGNFRPSDFAALRLTTSSNCVARVHAGRPLGFREHWLAPTLSSMLHAGMFAAQGYRVSNPAILPAIILPPRSRRLPMRLGGALICWRQARN